MTATEIRLIAGPAGWVQARFGEGRAHDRLFVRFEPDPAGRWRPREWSIPHVAPERLSRIPYRRILAAVSADEQVRDALAARFTEEPEPGFRGTFGEARPPRTPLLPLKRPAGRRLDASFYAAVAKLYRQAVGRGLNPRKTVSEQAGVSVDVAGRWIYEARKLGLIPKTTPGKVTV